MKKKIKSIPFLGGGIILLLRIKIVIKILIKTLIYLLKWLIFSKETTNYTYNLQKLNKIYLISFISNITKKSFNEIASYVQELENDSKLKQHIILCIKQNKERIVADLEPKYGRRLGWYAFVRATKPKVVIETGVDKGLGACVITSALMRNAKEGYSGYYYGTEIDKEKGYLLGGVYAKFGKILYGDSIESLKKFNNKINIFINDSDHSSDYEAKEYEIIKNKLGKNSLILGDNCLCTDKLLKFSLENKRKFALFQEKPKNHWYPGASIGVSF